MATSQQRQAPERACITFSQISYDQLIKTVVHFSSSFMHCKLDMRLLQGNDNICDFQIFSAATTTAAETLLHFSTQHFSMYPPHNISSVFLTTTTYVRRSGRITNGMLSGRKATQDSAFSSPTQAPTPRNDPPKKSLGPAQPPPQRCRTFPLLLVQMGYVFLCGLWVRRRGTNRRLCCPSMSNPSTSPRTSWPDSAGRRDNWIAAQHLPRDLVRPSSGFNNSLKRKKKEHPRADNCRMLRRRASKALRCFYVQIKFCVAFSCANNIFHGSFVLQCVQQIFFLVQLVQRKFLWRYFVSKQNSAVSLRKIEL